MASPLQSFLGLDEQGKVIAVTESMLTCEKCFEIVSDGKYYPDDSLLTWVCSKGHNNELKGFKG